MSNMRTVYRKLFCVTMTITLIVLTPSRSLRPIYDNVALAQSSEDPVFWASDQQFDGSRYYYNASMTVEGATISWRLFLNNETERIVSEIVTTGVGVDPSAFLVDFPNCVGFDYCASVCNPCVIQGNSDCFDSAVYDVLTAAFTIGAPCAACILSTAITFGLSLVCAFACGVAFGVVIQAIKSRFRLCKLGVPGTCSSRYPGCTCRAIGS